MLDHGLAGEPVDCRPEGLIEVKPGAQPRIIAHALDAGPEDHTLHDIRRPDTPDLGREHDVVRSVNLRPVVPARGLPRERHKVLASPVLNLEESLRNIHIRRPVLAHSAELQQMSFRREIADGEQRLNVVVRLFS